MEWIVWVRFASLNGWQGADPVSYR
ncbi:hypothetical protein BN10_590022 [Phycicoccus elongatus Lp2]|uniref:Uncharacterized protein n=1 Tax=Phycicoccus elongatus Lp2 TaxID=1193181 RepID=N0E3Z9_9MICO|nr:hypothetical protein BN10_590022 [Phycicoccus elongatus Lp2]